MTWEGGASGGLAHESSGSGVNGSGISSSNAVSESDIFRLSPMWNRSHPEIDRPSESASSLIFFARISGTLNVIDVVGCLLMAENDFGHFTVKRKKNLSIYEK